MSSTLQSAALAVLTAKTLDLKCAAADGLKALWEQGKLMIADQPDLPPDHPGRPARPELVAPAQVKRRRLGSPAGRAALLHAVAHIEFNAIDLAADMLARFAHDKRLEDARRTDFAADWVQVCADEARHFRIICDRLSDFDVEYGDHPAHNGLWEAAFATRQDLAARLVIAPMVLEARGLDVTPGMIEKLLRAGDAKSAAVLQIILDEEVAHVAAGVRWFTHICERESKQPEPEFKQLLQKNFRGILKPPFNEKARNSAGLTKSFYETVSEPVL